MREEMDRKTVEEAIATGQELLAQWEVDLHQDASLTSYWVWAPFPAVWYADFIQTLRHFEKAGQIAMLLQVIHSMNAGRWAVVSSGLRKRAGVSRGSWYKAIRRLKRAGMLEVKTQPGKESYIRLRFDPDYMSADKVRNIMNHWPRRHAAQMRGMEDE